MSFTELAIIAVLALVLLGPDQLPEAARKAAKGLRILRQAADGLRAEMRALERRASEDDGVAAGLSALRDLRDLAGQATAHIRSEVFALTQAPEASPEEAGTPSASQGGNPEAPPSAPPPAPDASAPKDAPPGGRTA